MTISNLEMRMLSFASQQELENRKEGSAAAPATPELAAN
jgi:hypothetical protein